MIALIKNSYGLGMGWLQKSCVFVACPNFIRFYRFYIGFPLIFAIGFMLFYLYYFFAAIFLGEILPPEKFFTVFPETAKFFVPEILCPILIYYALGGYILASIIKFAHVSHESKFLNNLLKFFSLPLILTLLLSGLGVELFKPEFLRGYQYSAINAILPYSDAAGHFSWQLKYFFNGVLNDWILRRPFGALLGAGIQGLGGGIYWVSIILRCLLTGTSLWIMAYAIKKSGGIWASLIAIAFAWHFLWGFLATFLSEMLGFLWAFLAVAAWLEALRRDSIKIAFIAFFLTLVAQFTRMGNMFLIPFLGLFIVVHWGTGKNQAMGKMKICAIVCVIAVAIVCASYSLLKLGNGRQAVGSNFSYTLAGLSLGGTWNIPGKIYSKEIQEINSKGEGEKGVSSFLYRKALKNIRDNPHIFLKRLWEGETAFWKDLYHYLPGNGHIALFLFLLVMLKAFSFNRTKWLFWSAVGFGIATSIPLIYFDGGMRVIVLSQAFICAFFSMAIYVQQDQEKFETGASHITPAFCASAFGASLAALMVWTIFWPRLAPFQPFQAIAAYEKKHPVKFPIEYALGAGRNPGFIVWPDNQSLPSNTRAMYNADFKSLVEKINVGLKDITQDAKFPQPPFAVICQPTTVVNRYLIAPVKLLTDKNVTLWKISLSDFYSGGWQFALECDPVLKK